MNHHTKRIAAAVALALTTVSAHALTLPSPAQGTTNPSSTTLVLSIWDPNQPTSNQASEVVNLGYSYAQLTGNLNPSAAGSPYTPASAPTGSGEVLQLDFGTISGLTDGLFPSADKGSLVYSVFATANGSGIDYTATSLQTLSASAAGTVNTHIGTLINNWPAGAGSVENLASSGSAVPTSAASSSGVVDGGFGVGGAGFALDGSVNSALNFYNISYSTHTVSSNTAIGGYFYLNSSTGDLTYNVAYTPPTPSVPLPAAVWLLGSGLLGLAGIGRRKPLAA
jgi:hypothetical protein